MDEEGAATQEALSRLLQKADKLLAVLKAPARVQAIADHVAAHFQASVPPLGFKAMLVTVDREACALYKEALDRILPPDWSTVVFSAFHKDPEQLRRYHLDDDTEKRVRRAFRDPEQGPKILIVTEKLLTGYDAPIAYAMYLDKPLKDHTLLQAIARVNRPYPNKKSGLIVDYLGIFENLQRALAFDHASITKGLIDLERLKAQFTEWLTRVEGRVERIPEYFFEPDRREPFLELFTQVQDAYEILSPDAFPFLRPYLDRYALIAQVYQVVYGEFDPRARQQRLDRELLKKTDALIREHVAAEPVAAPLPINRNIADVVRADNVSEQVKVIALQRSILAHVEQLSEAQPYLLTISEAVEAIIAQLHQRQISVEAALAQLTAKAEEMVRAEVEREQSPLDNLAFSFKMVLRRHDWFDASNLDAFAGEAARARPLAKVSVPSAGRFTLKLPGPPPGTLPGPPRFQYPLRVDSR